MFLFFENIWQDHMNWLQQIIKPHLGGYLKKFFLNPDPCGFMIPFDACFPFFFENGWGKKPTNFLPKATRCWQFWPVEAEASASKESPKQGATDEPEPMAEPEAEEEVLNLGRFTEELLKVVES